MSDDSETQYKFIMEKFNTINDSLTLFKMEISTLQKLVKNVEKDVTKELNNIKKSKKKEKSKTKRAPFWHEQQIFILHLVKKILICMFSA